jgi:phosphoglycerate dehydrogenase-like enzyme
MDEPAEHRRRARQIKWPATHDRHQIAEDALMPKVLITPMTLTGARGPYLQVLRDAGLEPVFSGCPHQLSEEELLQALPGISATLAGSEPYTARVLAAHPGLRIIARLGVGYDAVDLSAATRSGVVVTIAAGANQDAVAEHAFSLILGLAKEVVPAHLGTCAGRWPRRITRPVRGSVLGVAGLGRIGKAMVVRGRAFGMRVLAYDTVADTAFAAAHQVTLVSLDRLLAESDFLSLHLPLTAESQHMINRQTLAQMKPDAFLINTARGGLVCENDLVEALQSGQIAGAGLDVYEQEPPRSGPLFDLDNVLLTPHTAGTDTQSLADMALSAAESIAGLRHGRWPADKVVNSEVRQQFRWD